MFDGVGLNGSRLVRQVPASDLFNGTTFGSIPIGSQAGFDAGTLDQLGGGFASVSVRITLFDGDNAMGEFDFNRNRLLVNGVDFGNFSTVATTETDEAGTVRGTGVGFGNDRLDTGFFTVTGGAALGTLFTALATTGRADFSLSKFGSTRQDYNFAGGANAPLIGGGDSPGGPEPDIATPPEPDGPQLPVVPLPAAGLLLLTALAAAVALRRRTA